MHVINARNVHAALPEALRYLMMNGDRRDSRNGPVLVADTPVTTLYRAPRERVLFWPARDANPFFHLMESIWMLGGRRDVAFPQRFAANFGQYSDDGKVFHGAYGFRWRQAFGFDQLKVIAANLKANGEDRRQVLGMWSPKLDLDAQQGEMKDLPCNLVVHFQINKLKQLDMTVFCRSNDIVWGCYGANAVHFSYLLEYMAARVGAHVGRYWQVSSNWHGYLKTLEPLAELAQEAEDPFHRPYGDANPYDGTVGFYPLLDVGEDPDVFDQDVGMFLEEGAAVIGYRSSFIRRVAIPVLQAWLAFKKQDGSDRHAIALEILDRCEASDWQLACKQWIERRRDRQNQVPAAA